MQFDDASYESGGKFVSTGFWCHPERIIKSNEIIFVTKGNFKIFEENIEYNLFENSILILESGKRHFGFETNKKIEFFWFHYNSDENIFPHEKFLNLENSQRILLLSKQLLHTANTNNFPKKGNDYLIRLILMEIFMVASENSANLNPALPTACEYIRNNIRNNLTIKEISEKVSLNSDYLSRIFKNAYKTSLKKYIDNEKLKYIKNLLLTTNMPLKEIAEILNFSDCKSFLKFVKYHDGTTPQKIRSAYFNTHINHK